MQRLTGPGFLPLNDADFSGRELPILCARRAQPGEELPCYRVAFPMCRLRDIAWRHSVQILFVGCREGLADLRKVKVMPGKDTFHL